MDEGGGREPAHEPQQGRKRQLDSVGPDSSDSPEPSGAAAEQQQQQGDSKGSRIIVGPDPHRFYCPHPVRKGCRRYMGLAVA
jgi:hypothetical protein